VPGSDSGFEILRSQPGEAGESWILAARVPAETRLVAGHFPGHPIVPGVALLALVARALADWRGAAGEILGIGSLKLRRPVAPGDALLATLRPAGAGDTAGSSGIAFELRRDGDGGAGGETVASGVVRAGARERP